MNILHGIPLPPYSGGRVLPLDDDVVRDPLAPVFGGEGWGEGAALPLNALLTLDPSIPSTGARAGLWNSLQPHTTAVNCRARSIPPRQMLGANGSRHVEEQGGLSKAHVKALQCGHASIAVENIRRQRMAAIA